MSWQARSTPNRGERGGRGGRIRRGQVVATQFCILQQTIMAYVSIRSMSTLWSPFTETGIPLATRHQLGYVIANSSADYKSAKRVGILAGGRVLESSSADRKWVREA